MKAPAKAYKPAIIPDQPVNDKNLVDRSIMERISVKSLIYSCSVFIESTL